MKTLALLHAAQLVTLAGPKRPRVGGEMRELGIIPDGAMLIEDGRIVKTGPSAEIEKALPADAELIDARGRVVLPGFVDAHAHPVFAGDRVDEFEMRTQGATYEQIAERGGGIRSTVRKTRAASEEELLAQAKKHAAWFLKGGTTTVEAKSGYGLTMDDELKMLRVIRRLNTETPIEFVPTFLGAHAIPEEFQKAPEQYVALVIHKMLPRVVEEQLAENCDVFCERGYFDITESEKILRAAQEQGLRLRMHVDQLTNSGRSVPGGAVAGGNGRSFGAGQRGRDHGAGGSGSAARPVARFGLLVRQDALSAGPGNDRGRPGGCARNGLQSRFVAHAVDADGPITGGDADEDDAGGMPDRGDD